MGLVKFMGQVYDRQSKQRIVSQVEGIDTTGAEEKDLLLHSTGETKNTKPPKMPPSSSSTSVFEAVHLFIQQK